jgi:hypothetical protein
VNRTNYSCNFGISYLDKEMLHTAQNSKENVLSHRTGFRDICTIHMEGRHDTGVHTNTCGCTNSKK